MGVVQKLEIVNIQGEDGQPIVFALKAGFGIVELLLKGEPISESR